MEITIREYAEKAGINYNTARYRLNRHCKRVGKSLYEYELYDVDWMFEPQRGIGGKLTSSQIAKIVELRAKGLPFWAIAEKVGCCEDTARKYAKKGEQR